MAAGTPKNIGANAVPQGSESKAGGPKIDMVSLRKAIGDVQKRQDEQGRGK